MCLLNKDLQVWEDGFLRDVGTAVRVATSAALTRAQGGQARIQMVERDPADSDGYLRGASTYGAAGLASLNALNGRTYRLPAGTALPPGLSVMNDVAEHWAIVPTAPMSLWEYFLALGALEPAFVAEVHGCPITWGLLSQKRAIAKQLTEEWRWRAGNGPEDDYMCAAHCEDMMRIWNSTAALFCTRVDELGPVVRESPSSLASVFVSDCAIVGYRAARALTGASDDYVAAAAADDAMEFAMLFRRLGGDMEYFHNCVDDVATPK